jgi:hypothetical protein
MEAICSSETDYPEEITLHNHRCENLRSRACSITHVLHRAARDAGMVNERGSDGGRRIAEIA